MARCLAILRANPAWKFGAYWPGVHHEKDSDFRLGFAQMRIQVISHMIQIRIIGPLQPDESAPIKYLS